MADNKTMNDHESTEKEINNAAVKRYFDNAKGGTAATVSMMKGWHSSHC